MKELRKALDDDSRSPRFVRTVYGFGYSFDEVPASVRPRVAEQSRFILVWSGNNYPLSHGENILGRDVEANVRIDSAGVSRRHAMIRIDEATATIEDLGSKNGTFVNGIRAERSLVLSEADEIRLGSALLRVRVTSPAETTLTEAPKS